MARPWPAPRPGRVTDGTVVSPRAANALVAVSLILLLGVVSFTAPRWSLWLRRPLPAADLSPERAGEAAPSRQAEPARGSQIGLGPSLPTGTRVLEVFVTARGVAYVDLSKEAATPAGRGSDD